jgi:hypothetical protein
VSAPLGVAAIGGSMEFWLNIDVGGVAGSLELAGELG